MSAEPEAEPPVELAGERTQHPVLSSQALAERPAEFLCVNPAWLCSAAPNGERAYCIWRWPSRPELVGVWCGSREGYTAWRAILAEEPSHKYCGSRMRLKAYTSLEDAAIGWKVDCPRDIERSKFTGLFFRF